MVHKEKNHAFRMLVLIANSKLGENATEVFLDNDIPIHYHLNGIGTASSERVDILGLGSSDKTVLISVLPKEFANQMLFKLRRELRIGRVNSGIAFTLPISGASNIMLKMIAQMEVDEETSETGKEGKAMTDQEYSMIAVIVEQGYSEEIMDTARKAGANGGTVLHSRGIGDETKLNVWNFSIQGEKEIIVIAALNKHKLDIMQSISEKYGINTKAKGVVISVPIDNVIGLDYY